MKFTVSSIGWILSGTYGFWDNWYTATGKIWQHFQGWFCPSCVCQVYFYVSLQSFMTCGWSFKETFFSIIYYTILFISITPRSLSSKFSCSPITRSPIHCSPIACLLPSTRYLVFCCPTCSLIAWSLFVWFSKNNPRETYDSNISGSHQKYASYDRGASNCMWIVLQKRHIPNI